MLRSVAFWNAMKVCSWDSPKASTHSLEHVCQNPPSWGGFSCVMVGKGGGPYSLF